MILALLLSCAEPPPAQEAAADPVADPVELIPLDAPRLLRRRSLDLRGALPTLAELDAVEADPAQLDTLTAAYLTDPAHEERLVDIFATRYQSRIDEYNVPASDFGLDDTFDNYPFLRAVGDEPARLLAHVVAQNQPWSDAVTLDTTMANATLVALFNLEWVSTPPADGWAPARYTDGRPPLGVLATNGFFWRYATTLNNLNRGRAAAISHLLLCDDILQRPVVIEGLSVFSPEALLAATQEVPSCQSCHATLDPLAANLFGYWWYDVKDANEMARYHPEREALGATYLGQEPAYFGTPLPGVAALGPAIAADPRFARCFVSQMAEELWHRRLSPDDFDAISEITAAFEADALHPRTAIAALIQSPAYTVGAFTPDASAETQARESVLRTMTVEQLADAVEDATGYRWAYNNYDQLDNDILGYRVMAGGLDGLVVGEANAWPQVSRSLVIQRLAQAAAQEVVTHDLLVPIEERRLLGTVDPAILSLLPGDPAFTAELTRLHRRLHGTSPDAAALTDDEALWTAIRDEADEEMAWRVLVGGMLRDPLFWSL